ncbi:YceD family protein [Crenobacter cavernae]|uniref:YceD family protein n=1 Tax=Crenobacter cavernae TaxID=2290923 RepID=UPI001F0C6C4A|nr:YceD family protein [Crenobacter cavernae]
MIDPLAFAREGLTLSGDVAVATLDGRVLEALADTNGTLRYALSGSVDKLRRHHLTLSVDGEVTVTCQRCLVPMVQVLQLSSAITLFSDEEKLAEAVEADEELDAIMAEPELDVMALIEDEIIMGLPVSPKHEACGQDVLDSVKVEKPNPFAVLATLKKNQAR